MKNAAGQEDQAPPRVDSGSTRKPPVYASFSLSNYARVEPAEKFFFSATVYLRDGNAPATFSVPSPGVSVDFTPYFSTGRPLTKVLGGTVTVEESTEERLAASFSLVLGAAQTDGAFTVAGRVVVDDCEVEKMCQLF